jgi:hypothetical protein
MKALAEPEIRASFVNCSKGEAARLPLPRALAVRPWGDLDFLGWSDLSAPDRSYLVASHGDGLVGVTLRHATGGRGYLRRSMCSLCLTTHPGSGVALMTARKAGAAGRQGDSVGTYICTDLACSLYVRGKKSLGAGGRIEESLTVDEQIARTRAHLNGFLNKLFD